MKKLLKIVSWAALAMLIIPPFCVYSGHLDLQTSKHWMFAATVIWFGTAPLWMDGKER